MKTNEERLQDLFAYLDRQTHVQPEEIPNIDLYMDQVTTFMEEHLKNTRRYEEDKVLTKTMINNYAKNHLLPSPNKKKYSNNFCKFFFIFMIIRHQSQKDLTSHSAAKQHSIMKALNIYKKRLVCLQTSINMKNDKLPIKPILETWCASRQ